MNTRRIQIAATVLVAACSLSVLRAAEELRTIDGRSLEGTLTSVAADAVVFRTADAHQTFAPADVELLRFADAANPMQAKGTAVLVSAAGDVLPVRDVATEGSVLRLKTGIGDLKAELGAVRAVYFPGAGDTPASVAADLAKFPAPDAAKDTLVIHRPDKPLLLAEGVLVSIAPGKITFRLRDEDRTIDRASVRAILFAQLPAAATPPAGAITLRNGTRLAVRSLTADAKQFHADTFLLGPYTVQRKDAASVVFHSDRVVRLADLKPSAVREVPLFDTRFPYRTNRSVGGGPLRLGEKEYEEGLGLHSLCELTYDLGGAYRAFTATVGIDDAVRPRGDATLTILADGMPLGEPIRLTGATEPVSVRLPVEGVKQLTIRVDYGEDKLDVADHVDLVNARLIK